MGKTKTKTDEKELTGESFDALSDSANARVIQEIEDGTPEQRLAESRPMNKQGRARWREWKRRKDVAGVQPRHGTISRDRTGLRP